LSALLSFPTRRSSDLCNGGSGETARDALLYLKLRSAQLPPHKRGVCAQRLHKGVLASLDGLLHRRRTDGAGQLGARVEAQSLAQDRKSTRLNSSHVSI